MPRVLIVDDDENNRAVAADALECDEYELVEAVDGHDCLRKVAERPVEIILLDVMMPGIDGIETLRHLKADEATRNIPVIMVTALNMDSQVAACLDEGAIDHVSKPFSGMILRARVRSALRSKSQNAVTSAPTLQRGKTLAIVGAKGGVGATTLAVNIGAKLTQNGQATIICEVQPDAVSAAVQLGLQPRRPAEHLTDGEEVRLTRRMVEQSLLKHASGMRLLLGPSVLGNRLDSSPEAAAEFVQTLRELGQYTILDVGNDLSPASQECLRQADRLLLVLELETCSLAAAQRRLEVFAELGIHPAALDAVINNRVHIPSPPIGLNYVREQLSCDVVGVIPADPEGCSDSNRQGSPICLSRPESTTAGALTALANRMGCEHLAALTC